MSTNRNHLREVATARDTGDVVDCCEVEAWLYAKRGADVSPPADIADHLATCESCQAEQRESLLLPAATTESTTEFSDPLFVRSVMARVRKEPVPVRRQRRTALRVRAAALIAVLLLPVTVFLVSTIESDVAPVVHVTPESAVTHNSHSSADSNREVAHNDANAGRELVQGGMSVQLDSFESDRNSVDTRANNGWIPAFRGNEGSREIVSF